MSGRTAGDGTVTDEQLRRAAETAVDQCLGLDADESFVVVTDDERLRIGEAIYEVAGDHTDDAVLARYAPGDSHGEEPPEPVAGAMRTADAFLAPTTTSITHTRTRDQANETGARGATMPGITPEVMTAGMDADYESIAAECERVHTRVGDADELRVRSSQGTDLRIEPGGREWQLDTGLVREPGSFSNLPAGEVFVSPVTATGTVVVDGTMRPHGLIDEPVRFEVEDGRVIGVSDDETRVMLDEAGDGAYNFAEFGIGTNVGVTELTGSVLLDEKAAGTVHFAVGDNASMGGDVDAPLHEDGVVREPTVVVDGEELELPSA